MIRAAKDCREVILPYLIGDEMLDRPESEPARCVIDFYPRDQLQARGFAEPFERIKDLVLPARKKAAREEEKRNEEVLKKDRRANVNWHHRNFLNKWWLLSYPREKLISRLSRLPRYITCSRVTLRPIFEFVSSNIRPSDALQVFPFADDYSFGVLQSGIHWDWFTARCSTLTERFRYTSDTVFDTFPWPQEATAKEAKAVADAAVALRQLRRRVMAREGWGLRDLYRSLELPGKNMLRDAHAELDTAVRAAYGMTAKADPLAFLYELTQELADREESMRTVVPPGLPPCVEDRSTFVTDDCVQPPRL